MKQILPILTASALILLSACSKVEVAKAPSPSPTPAPASTPSPAPASAFEKVAQQLDANGEIYLYWGMDKILGALDKKIAAARDIALTVPELSPEEKERLTRNFDLGARILTDSGIQGVRAFGFSSKETAPGLFTNRSILLVEQPTGFLWDALGGEPKPLSVLELLPATTEAFFFYDFDLQALWNALSINLSASQIPEVTSWLEQLPQQVKAFTGLSLEELLASLGREVGMVITLEPGKRVKIPMGSFEHEMDQPAAALLWEVRDEKLYERLDAFFSLNPQLQKVDEPALKMRTLVGVSPLEFVRPTLGRYDKYLVISTSDQLLRAITETKAGKAPGLKSRPDFVKLAAGLPDRANMVQFASRKFQSAVVELNLRNAAASAGAGRGDGDLFLKFFDQLTGWSRDLDSYGVAGRRENGWFSVSHANKDINDLFGDFLGIIPLAAAGSSVDQLKNKRDAEKLAQIRAHLVAIQAAKEQAVAEGNLPEGQMLSRQDIEPFMAAWPVPVAGETYEIGVVGETPYAVAPVAIAEYPAGTKIEP